MSLGRPGPGHSLALHDGAPFRARRRLAGPASHRRPAACLGAGGRGWLTRSRAPVRGRDIRRIILDQSRRAGVGHIGSALCVADILAALYSGVLRMPSPEDPERDRFILSKGHAALALYAALHLRGWVSRRQLDTFCGEDTLLGAHPERGLCGVDFCTGSLGHGLSVGAGAALAARLDGSPRRTFVLVSDAECNEGSLWEAARFAAHHRLASLVAVVDLNGQQAYYYGRQQDARYARGWLLRLARHRPDDPVVLAAWLALYMPAPLISRFARLARALTPGSARASRDGRRTR
jgi:transketolase N-terminal domain/subunit